MNKNGRTLTEAVFGGTAYCLIELAYRGYTHPSMFVAGGISFAAVAALDRHLPKRICIGRRCLIGCGIITAVEFLTGCVVNLWLGLHVWDYSRLPFNVLGQICVPFCGAWFVLSGAIIYAARLMERMLCADTLKSALSRRR